MITRKTLLTLLVVVGTFLLVPHDLNAQESSANSISETDIQLLRKDLRSMKKQLVATSLQLSDDIAKKFWPVYDQYTQDTIRLNDNRYSLIKDYAANYGSMTDAQAQSFTAHWIDVDNAFLRLKAKYVPLFQRILPPKKSALFFQFDRRICLLIDLQLASEIPLVQP